MMLYLENHPVFLGIGKLRQTHVKDIDLCPFAYALYRQGKLGHLHILFK